nr:MAG TPA: hypothetical protein [Caudoviricetes sp.]
MRLLVLQNWYWSQAQNVSSVNRRALHRSSEI